MERWHQCFLAFLTFVVLFSYYLNKKNVFTSPVMVWQSSRSNLSWKEMMPYFSWKDVSACRTYYEFGGVLNRLPSLTFLDGQKSVCLDRGISPVPDQCVVYSFGNNGEWSFDEQIESYGCEVYVFDPSVW